MLRPIEDRVMVELSNKESLSAGGIVLPPTETNCVIGIVKAIGPGRTFDSGVLKPMTVQVGDTIYFKQDNAVELQVSGKSYYIISEPVVLAIEDL